MSADVLRQSCQAADDGSSMLQPEMAGTDKDSQPQPEHRHDHRRSSQPPPSTSALAEKEAAPSTSSASSAGSSTMYITAAGSITREAANQEASEEDEEHPKIKKKEDRLMQKFRATYHTGLGPGRWLESPGRRSALTPSSTGGSASTRSAGRKGRGPGDAKGAD